ncbi:hypothetical protein EDC14_104915 [Hydrogenispora ethanolica]|jgi:hypothetical protein|uniref:Uncharacterized protein n=1 Tax=Hydrogenispora ethanolica TaxID=1082276 RepID=A0A4R1QTT6_HYDET|nr:hypothetical protein [Hydrogenispora ethanolica]TCL56491.1 hypothetical protein EDC14_104915 [Hydrogenispora ethanolica]
MDHRSSEKYDIIAQECGGYEPILSKNLASSFEYGQTEDAGCDTCVNFHNGSCDIYKNEAGY